MSGAGRKWEEWVDEKEKEGQPVGFASLHSTVRTEPDPWRPISRTRVGVVNRFTPGWHKLNALTLTMDHPGNTQAHSHTHKFCCISYSWPIIWPSSPLWHSELRPEARLPFWRKRSFCLQNRGLFLCSVCVFVYVVLVRGGTSADKS